ncbi:DNA-directed RNA polymerase [Sarcoptes scabiei]|nr:DNA-directed RNA polymerase [Sarcoptes scabiei]
MFHANHRNKQTIRMELKESKNSIQNNKERKKKKRRKICSNFKSILKYFTLPNPLDLPSPIRWQLFQWVALFFFLINLWNLFRTHSKIISLLLLGCYFLLNSRLQFAPNQFICQIFIYLFIYLFNGIFFFSRCFPYRNSHNNSNILISSYLFFFIVCSQSLLLLFLD